MRHFGQQHELRKVHLQVHNWVPLGLKPQMGMASAPGEI